MARQSSGPAPSRPKGPTSARWWNRPRASEHSSSGRQRSGRVLPKISFQAVDLAFSPDASLARRLGQGRDRFGSGRCPMPPRWPRSDRGPRPSRASPSAGFPDAAPSSSAAGRWLLAAGDAGGTVTVWDLEKQVPMNYCRGSQLRRLRRRLQPRRDDPGLGGSGLCASFWDVATGRLLLDLKPRNAMTALAFSPDGTRLAVGSNAAFGFAGGVDVYELEEGRGIRTFRGLLGHVPKTIFSPDGGSSRGFHRIGGSRSGIESPANSVSSWMCPTALFADNSGLAFSPDGRRFAFSAGRQAKLWDIETGKELGAWTLPEGLQDTLAFHGPEPAPAAPHGNDRRRDPARTARRVPRIILGSCGSATC